VDLLAEHLVRPVEFVRQVTAMHDAGARVFVEVGPRSVLSGLISRILANKPHHTVSFDQPAKPGLVQLLNGLGSLAAEGVDLDPRRLFDGRSPRLLHVSQLGRDTGSKPLSPTTWLVNGGRAMLAAEVAKTTIKTSVSVIVRGPSDQAESSHPPVALLPPEDYSHALQHTTISTEAPRGKHVKTLIESEPVDILTNGNGRSHGSPNGYRPLELPHSPARATLAF